MLRHWCSVFSSIVWIYQKCHLLTEGFLTFSEVSITHYFKVVRGCCTQVHMLITDDKINIRIVHVDFRRWDGKLNSRCWGGLVTASAMTRGYITRPAIRQNITAPRAPSANALSVYTQFISNRRQHSNQWTRYNATNVYILLPILYVNNLISQKATQFELFLMTPNKR